jgi:hypothetical protein
MVAALLCTCDLKVFPKQVEEGDAGVKFQVVGLLINGYGQFDGRWGVLAEALGGAGLSFKSR